MMDELEWVECFCENICDLAWWHTTQRRTAEGLLTLSFAVYLLNGCGYGADYCPECAPVWFSSGGQRVYPCADPDCPRCKGTGVVSG
jgi:hypothetical protein